MHGSVAVTKMIVLLLSANLSVSASWMNYCNFSTRQTFKMKKVMILANDTTYTYNLRNEIIERLVTEGYEVIIVSQPLLHQDKLKLLGCRLINLETNRHGTNPVSDLKLLLTFRKILLKEKPDVVLSYNIKPNVYGGLACRLTRTHYLPNITGLGTAVEHPGLMQKLTTRLYKVGVAGADCVFFQNTENKMFFEQHNMLNTKTKIRLLPGSGVSLKIHRPLPYPTEDDIINFLFIARIMKEKGIELYINAAKRIYEGHKNVIFHICGYCDDNSYLQRIKDAEKDGYIAYHGEQKDMIPFFKMAHCIVHPSYYPEGMSNVLLEAAAHCRPVIATDRAGCRETVNDKESGYVIPIKNEDALIGALESFLQLSWEEKYEMGLAGRKKIENEFDRRLVAQAYLEEIEKIVKKQEL